MAASKKKYNEDVIKELVNLELGTRFECIKASSMVTNFNDINVVLEQLEKLKVSLHLCM